MGTFIVRYLVGFAVFLGIDAIWLGFIAKNLYAKTIGHLLSSSPKYIPALIFYLVYVVGIIIFAVNPALKSKSPSLALQYGALLGFISYATYDLTNLATLRDWPLKVTIIDIVWGTLLTGSVSLITYFILNR